MLFPGKNPWDIAPVKLIVEEAGGKVTNMLGGEERYDRKDACLGMIVGNARLHAELLEMVRKNPKRKT